MGILEAEESMMEPRRPLGVRSDVALTNDQRDRLAALDAYDLDHVRRRLINNGLLPESWVEEALLEYKRFVGLRILHGPGIGMTSPYVDEVWHQSILFTREYFEFSDLVVGSYLHHAPNAGDDPVAVGSWSPDASFDGSVYDAVARDVALGGAVARGAQDPGSRFIELYEITYGPLPDLWVRHIQAS